MDLNVNRCICGNEQNYKECCGRLIEYRQSAQSALELMRSRYSAYVLQNGQYLYETCSKKLKNKEEAEAINEENIEWLGLTIESYNEKEVVFMAYYKENSIIQVMKEHSFFIIEDGNYRYDRGEIMEAKISRNDPCPCASGKKYKKCCG